MYYLCGNEEGFFVKYDIFVLIMYILMLIINYRL